jgi:hypothetical protein
MSTDIVGVACSSRACTSPDRASWHASQWSFAALTGVGATARRLNDALARHVGGMTGGHRYLLGSERELWLGSFALALFREYWPNSARNPDANLPVEACHPHGVRQR